MYKGKAIKIRRFLMMYDVGIIGGLFGSSPIAPTNRIAPVSPMKPGLF
jgi:hypothetical protein